MGILGLGGMLWMKGLFFGGKLSGENRNSTATVGVLVVLFLTSAWGAEHLAGKRMLRSAVAHLSGVRETWADGVIGEPGITSCLILGLAGLAWGVGGIKLWLTNFK